MYEYDVWNAFRYILKYRPLRPFSRPRGTSASTKNDSSPPLMLRVNTHTHSHTHIHTRERLWSAMTIINPGNWRVFARKRYFPLRLVVKSKKTYGGRDVLLDHHQSLFSFLVVCNDGRLPSRLFHLRFRSSIP